MVTIPGGVSGGVELLSNVQITGGHFSGVTKTKTRIHLSIGQDENALSFRKGGIGGISVGTAQILTMDE